MRHRRTPTPPGHRASPDPEGSLKQVTFLGSFPNPRFRLPDARPEILFIGRSNVGKSSLINVLTRRKSIARTSKTPGKTRECNVYAVDEVLYLVDLPGYGYARASHDERERITTLVDEVLAARDQLAGVVWLLDIRREPSREDLRIGAMLVRHGTPVLVAITKGDKLAVTRRNARAGEIAESLGLQADQAIVTSSKSKEGIDDLRDSIVALAESSG